MNISGVNYTNNSYNGVKRASVENTTQTDNQKTENFADMFIKSASVVNESATQPDYEAKRAELAKTIKIYPDFTKSIDPAYLNWVDFDDKELMEYISNEDNWHDIKLLLRNAERDGLKPQDFDSLNIHSTGGQKLSPEQLQELKKDFNISSMDSAQQMQLFIKLNAAGALSFKDLVETCYIYLDTTTPDGPLSETSNEFLLLKTLEADAPPRNTLDYFKLLLEMGVETPDNTHNESTNRIISLLEQLI